MSVRNLLSIIVVNYNGERFVEDCVRSILSSTYPNFEIILVDNNSTDQSIRKLEEFRKDSRFKPVYLTENLHYAGGNNVGISHSTGEYVLFLNSDTVLEKNCLDELVKEFQSDNDTTAIQCILRAMEQNRIISDAGGTIDFCGRLMPVSLLWEHNAIARKERRLFWACGAALALRREILNSVGWFDPQLPTDEVDLCWRINLARGKIVLSRESVVRHLGSASFGKDLTKERLYLGELARLHDLLTNCDSKNIAKFTPYIVSYFMISIGWDVFFRRRMDILLFRLKAHVQCLWHLKQILVKRSIVQKYIRRLSDAEIMKLMVKPNPYYW
jgi:GT2 family glycosyltransferase